VETARQGDKDGVDYRISHTPLALVYHCEIITATQSRLKPEVAPPHNDVIRQLNGILTAHLNLSRSRARAIRAPPATSP